MSVFGFYVLDKKDMYEVLRKNHYLQEQLLLISMMLANIC